MFYDILCVGRVIRVHSLVNETFIELVFRVGCVRVREFTSPIPWNGGKYKRVIQVHSASLTKSS